MAAEQLDLINATDGVADRYITTVAKLWAAYYPGVTPEQAYWDARAKHDQWHEHYKAVQAVTDTFHDCRDEAERAEYWKRLAAAQAELLRFDGVPDKWIDEHGRDCAPLELCRYCWRPGAVDIDDCGGCTEGYHVACYRAMSIRCDLRIAAAERILRNDEERAAMWERTALAKHNETRGA